MATLTRAHVTRAFGLAYFFHPDRATALEITARAIGKVGLAERAQARRVYYKPKGRNLRLGADPRPLRTKISVDRAHLLQRLVLLECDLLDRQHEQQGGAATLSDEEFVLRFVRVLVGSSSRRNSLYVATGLGRILHGYSTAEVQEIFAVVVQDPERTPDDSYVRSVKQRLFGELKRRFDGLVRTRTGPRGEEVFETVEPSPRWRKLVDSCLDRLTPWDTSCPVPRGFDALAQTLKWLRPIGADPDAEHPIEVRRMHSLIHPDCFARLTKGLRLRPPAEVLTVPRLYRPEGPPDAGGGPPDRSHPPPLDDPDFARLRSAVSSEDKAGRGVTHVIFRVDGSERARLVLDEGSIARFQVHDEDEVLELVGLADAREVPVALHLLGARPVAGTPPTEELVVAIARRWKVTVVVGQPTSLADPASPRRVEAACARLNRLGRLRRALLPGDGPGPSALRWVAAVPAVALLLAAALFVVARQRPTEVRPELPGPPATTQAPGEVTRGVARNGAPMTLESARTVYVGTLQGPDARRVADLLAASLRASERFTVVADPESADVALKGRLEIHDEGPTDPTAGRTFRLELQLVDEDGRPLWTVDEIDPDLKIAVERAVADLLHNAS